MDKSIEDDLREILVALRDVDGLDIVIERSDGAFDRNVESYIAGDITAGANKLAEVWKQAYEAGKEVRTHIDEPNPRRSGRDW